MTASPPPDLPAADVEQGHAAVSLRDTIVAALAASDHTWCPDARPHWPAGTSAIHLLDAARIAAQSRLVDVDEVALYRALVDDPGSRAGDAGPYTTVQRAATVIAATAINAVQHAAMTVLTVADPHTPVRAVATCSCSVRVTLHDDRHVMVWWRAHQADPDTPAAVLALRAGIGPASGSA
jgi:hypothetical protein